MRAAPPDLPVVDVLPALSTALGASHARAILVAPPGAGKTTLAPLWLLESGDDPAEGSWLGGQRIVMLEPRRLATRAAAQRMAALLGETVGGTVGYQTRDERRIGSSTRIEVVTEGVLTRRLQHDPSLDGVGLVIFDEVHERNLPTDLGLALALDACATLRPDLRLLAMSATPDVAALRRLLGDDTPVVESDGRMHPVDIVWCPVTAPSGGRGGAKGRPPMGNAQQIAEATTAVVQRALREQSGSVLVFLPGIGEIRRVQSMLEHTVPADVDVKALAGALSADEQDDALTARPGRRRVVLSTDIAESSLTVDGVRVVVDAGLARVPRFDPRTGMTRLTTVSTSRASADQRAGRAGRVEPGAAYRLWSKIEHTSRRAHLEAEITQVDLSGLALELAAWGSPDLRWIDPPSPRAMQQAHELLVGLEALDDDGRLTAVGRRMLDLPLHPRLAKMVAVAAEHAPADGLLACTVAAILDERDVLRGRPDELPADLALRVGVVCGDAHDRADRRDVQRVRDRALDIAQRSGIGRRGAARFDDIDPHRAGALLVLAYPDRVAVRRSQPGQFQMRSGTGAWVPPTDTLADERFVVAADLDGRRDGARIRIGAALDAADLAEALAHQVERRESITWDRTRDDLVERIEVRLGGMLLDEQVRAPRPGAAATAAIVERLRTTRLAALPWSERSTALRHRVAFLRRSECGDPPTDGCRWPDWSDTALLATLDDWLVPYLGGAASIADLQRIDLDMVLAAQFDWDTGQALAELAPSSLITPSGRSVAIDYSADVPTAEVRVQDMFGTTTHPTVGGRPGVAIALSLLSPADRPVQITRDLPGFWKGSWAEVRKEMAGRYPKHQWPVDPSVAPPKRLK